MEQNHPVRVLALQQSISEWQREHDHHIQKIRDATGDFRRIMRLSLRVMAVGSFPSIAWILCWFSVTFVSDTVYEKVGKFSLVMIVFGGAFLVIARGCGLLSFWWFRHSVMRERTATIVTALTGAAVLFGWAHLLLKW